MTKIENIENVAHRLKGLRDALDLTVEEFAKSCGIDTETYLKYESGSTDIPVSFIYTIAQVHGVELPALLFGEEPKMSSYFVTRNGKGYRVERSAAYSYQSLAFGFARKKLNPFMVTVEPNDSKSTTYNTHNGQEFNYVVAGKMEIHIGTNTIVLNEGDSIMFNSNIPHGMKALDGKQVKFLAVII